MSTLYALASVAGFVIVIACVSDYKIKNLRVSPYLILIAASLLVRLLFLNSAAGYDNDIATFKSWASSLFGGGISKFYGSGDYADYPPGYMYVLYVLGALQAKLNLSAGAFTALIKLPGVLCDLVVTAFVYKMALKRFAPKAAFLFGLAYALNPAVILDSAVWGQVDSVYTMLLLVSVSLLADKKFTGSFALYALAVLVKPQSLIAAPVFLYAFLDAVVSSEKENRRRVVLGLLKSVGAALCLIFALCLPFAGRPRIGRVLGAYLTALGAYPFASVNAYNLYAFLGANWKSMDGGFLGMTYNAWGMVFLVVTVFYAFFVLDRAKGKKSGYFAVTGMLYTLTFMLSVKMHERYLIPALVFFLAAFAHDTDKRFALFYGGFSLTAFVNCADVLNMLHNGNDTSLITVSMRFVSLVNLILAAVLAVSVIFIYGKKPAPPGEDEDNGGGKRPAERPLERDAGSRRLVKRDYLLMTGLSLFYAVIAFINLGSLHSPQTTWAPEKNQSAVIELAAGARATTFEFFPGARHEKSFRLETSPDGINWGGSPAAPEKSGGDRAPEIGDILSPSEGGVSGAENGKPMEFTVDSVFRWDFKQVDIPGPYVRITSLSDMLLLQEIGFRDAGGNLIPIKAAYGGAELCDEQQWVPKRASYMNGTYFDEIYHPRTAYEFLEGLWPYENTHPPLGKVIMSAGIALFGMTPFGWRVMGTLCGVLMIPLMYIFAKRMFGGTKWALFAAFVFTFDFMHFAQTRLATIDSYVTFFIMGMYLFMYEYSRINFFDPGGKRRHGAFIKSLAMLVCSGAAMGLAVASKWEGVYGALGLPVMLFYTLFKRLREYVNAKKGGGDVPLKKARRFPRYILITAAVCVAAFIAVPAVIYCLSYIPYLRATRVSGLGNSLKAILDNQSYMLRYHSGVTQSHPYSSRWFEWPLMIKPIYYYAGSLANGLREGITSFGNPALWWTGVAAVIYGIRRISKGAHDADGGILPFLFVAYGSQYLPWIFIGRTTFIYHYFPSVPFVALLVTFFFKDCVQWKNPKLVWGYMIAVFALFALFYPTISGMPVPGGYAEALSLMPGWVLS